MFGYFCYSLLTFLLGGKSSVLLEVKPWDDETDMKKLEEAVRSVQMPGLTWGACKSKNVYLFCTRAQVFFFFWFLM